MRTYIVEHVDQLIQLGVATYLVLVGLGIIRLKKTREANDAFLKKWRTLFLILGASLGVIAVFLMCVLHHV
jgi:hypothetical protein